MFCSIVCVGIYFVDLTKKKRAMYMRRVLKDIRLLMACLRHSLIVLDLLCVVDRTLKSSY